LQFVAHDAVSYNIAQGTLATWPQNGNAYFAVSLNIFNRGNRPAALVSATARLIQRKLRSDQRRVVDADCNTSPTERPNIKELFSGTEENFQPYLGAVHKYAASIEGGKLSTDNFIFRIFADNDKSKIPQEDKHIEGIVCLALIFADSQGVIYPSLRALYGVRFQFDQEKFEHIDAGLDIGGPGLRLVTVIDERRIELPL
jgi:hypothetical protein